MGFFSKISDGLKKTRDSFLGALGDVLGGFTLALIELILVINFTKKRFRGN